MLPPVWTHEGVCNVLARTANLCYSLNTQNGHFTIQMMLAKYGERNWKEKKKKKPEKVA